MSAPPGRAVPPPPPLAWAAPARAERGSARWQRVRPPVVLAGVVLAGSVALHVRDPHESGSWGLCPWLLLTGTYCPGCGGLRAVNDLTHGEIRAAFSSNALFVAGIPALVGLWLRSLAQRWRGVVRPWPAALVTLTWVSALGALLVFTVARNLPVEALRWLAP